MPPVTFCADAPIARSVIAWLVGVPAAALASFGAYRLSRGTRPGGAMRRFAVRSGATIAFCEVLLLTLVFIGGPCVFAGCSQGRFGVHCSTTPTSAIGAGEFALFLGVVFALMFSVTRTREQTDD